LFLGQRHGLAPADQAGWLWTHQLQLTIADAVVEIHDSHHPIASGLYYEDQKPEAKRRAKDLRQNRLPKYLGYFDRILARNPEGPAHLVGAASTYADLSLFQLIAGIRYAFPKAAARLLAEYSRLVALHDSVSRRPRIAAYLKSQRNRGKSPGAGLFGEAVTD
jgi:glutathione S-transferase